MLVQNADLGLEAPAYGKPKTVFFKAAVLIGTGKLRIRVRSYSTGKSSLNVERPRSGPGQTEASSRNFILRRTSGGNVSFLYFPPIVMRSQDQALA